MSNGIWNLDLSIQSRIPAIIEDETSEPLGASELCGLGLRSRRPIRVRGPCQYLRLSRTCVTVTLQLSDRNQRPAGNSQHAQNFLFVPSVSSRASPSLFRSSIPKVDVSTASSTNTCPGGSRQWYCVPTLSGQSSSRFYLSRIYLGISIFP